MAHSKPSELPWLLSTPYKQIVNESPASHHLGDNVQVKPEARDTPIPGLRKIFDDHVNEFSGWGTLMK